ncbi:MAG: AarF/UbiB family protein [Candidatus Gastranaerophilales bacterium]|nr:AarF/UbiB family protein [Candidatus Gastranaerophilales bacterium]MCM1073899.1 AarF/UbiB family protein [Bacteroides sp.]
MSDSKIKITPHNNAFSRQQMAVPQMMVAVRPVINSDKEMQDAFILAKKKRGLFARLLGSISLSRVSESKVKKQIENYKFGLGTKEQAQDYINRYHNSNTNTSEVVTDSLASMAAISAGFVIKKTQTFANIFTPKYKTQAALLTAAASIGAGFIAKLGLKGLDIAGMNKEGRKEQSFVSTLKSGAVDGITGYGAVLSPYLIPVGIAANLFSRYVDEKRNDKTMPSLSDFIEKQKDNLMIGMAGVAGVSAMAAHGHINIAKITNSIKAAAINKKHTISYRPPEGQLTEFQQLARDIGYDLSVIIKGEKFDPSGISKLDEDFMKILLESGNNGQIDDKIKKLELENIFLPKYLQTVVDIPEEQQQKLCRQIDQLVEGYLDRKNKKTYNGRDWSFNSEEFVIDTVMKELEKKGMDINGFKDLQGILKKIKSKCSTSRTISDAQNLLNSEYGGRFTIVKPCGVGSVAETYIAKDNNSGEEVIIKIVKDYFLCEDKIAKDRAKILSKIKERSREDYSWFTSRQTIFSPERKKYDINQVNNMFQVWGGEINLAQEAQAAADIGAQASTFNAVGVVDAKRNIFIMKKAEGVPLDSEDFVKLWKKENLTEADYKNWVEYYVKVYCEQLFSIPQNGKKVVQSDPHCGNIFGNPAKVRDIPNGAKALTIIDYGNTTQTEQAQAIKNLFNHLDYLVGNTESIAEAMLEGANIGKQNKNTVVKELAKALDESIYNADTKIDVDNPVKIFSTVNSFCLDFMQKKNIIPNASHINQMKAEETYIISNLGCMKNIADECGYDISKAIDKDAIIKLLVSEMSKATEDAAKSNPHLTYREIAKRYNFFVNNPEKALSCLGINFGIV